jgi:hypothetical protein
VEDSKESLVELCEHAANEHDPEQFQKILDEILGLLKAKKKNRQVASQPHE